MAWIRSMSIQNIGCDVILIKGFELNTMDQFLHVTLIEPLLIEFKPPYPNELLDEPILGPDIMHAINLLPEFTLSILS